MLIILEKFYIITAAPIRTMIIISVIILIAIGTLEKNMKYISPVIAAAQPAVAAAIIRQ